MIQFGSAIRCLVVVQWVTMIIGYSLSLIFESSASGGEGEISRAAIEAPVTAIDFFQAGWALLFVVSSIGLVMLRPWSRRLYAVTSLGNIALSPLVPASVVVAASEPFYQASLLANGAVLGVLLVSLKRSDPVS